MEPVVLPELPLCDAAIMDSIWRRQRKGEDRGRPGAYVAVTFCLRMINLSV